MEETNVEEQLQEPIDDGKRKPKKAEYATVEQFNQLSEMLMGIAKRLDERPVAVVKDDAAPVASPENPLPYIPLDPQVRKTVDDILGKDFGINLRYSNGVPIIDIIVPLEKSNAKPEYLEVHKIDMRSSSIAPGARTVKEWCQMVSKNLAKPRS